MVKFWVEQPSALLENVYFFPSYGMTLSEKLNALTRLVIVIAGVLLYLKNKWWLAFLTVGLLMIILSYYHGKSCEDDVKAENNIENFSVTPTYISDDFDQTIVAPLYAEEWQVPPPAYDLYTPDNTSSVGYAEPLQPQSYPYGQYLTKTNLLPIDEQTVALNGCGGARQAREYVNGAFLRNDLAFQENMTRIYKKSLDRRFKHNTNDTFSPFSSF